VNLQLPERLVISTAQRTQQVVQPIPSWSRRDVRPESFMSR